MEQSPGSVAQVLTTALSGLYKCHLVRTDGELPQSQVNAKMLLMLRANRMLVDSL